MVILAYCVNTVSYNNLWIDILKQTVVVSLLINVSIMWALNAEFGVEMLIKYLVNLVIVKVFFLNATKLYDYKPNRNILFFFSILKPLYRPFLELTHKMV